MCWSTVITLLEKNVFKCFYVWSGCADFLQKGGRSCTEPTDKWKWLFISSLPQQFLSSSLSYTIYMSYLSSCLPVPPSLICPSLQWYRLKDSKDNERHKAKLDDKEAERSNPGLLIHGNGCNRGGIVMRWGEWIEWDKGHIGDGGQMILSCTVKHMRLINKVCLA